VPSETTLEETGRVRLAFQERRMESEVGDAVEPLRSDEASSRWLHTPVLPFLQKGRSAEGFSQAIDALGTHS